MSDYKFTILVIDDEEKILDSIKRLFINVNYRILTVTNGKEGLDIVRNDKVNVIVCDWKMPEMDGVEVLKQTKVVSPDTTRIMLSAYSDKDVVIKIIKNIGIYKYILKPWDNEKFKNIINDAIIINLKRINSKKKTIEEINRNTATSNKKPDLSMEGKKIFFLYPHKIIQNIVKTIIKKGFIVYLLDDHTKIFKLLEKYKNVIIYINIDMGLKEKEWEKFIRNIRDNPRTKDVWIGIVTLYGNDILKKKYLEDIGIKGGFIKLKTDMRQSIQILFKVFEMNKMRGRRKNVRVNCNKDLDSFNCVYKNMKLAGYIHDISIVGMACSFQEELNVTEKTYFKDIQLVLRGKRCIVSGIVAAQRKTNQGKPLYIIMFNIKEMKLAASDKIFSFIYNCLQEEVSGIIKNT